PRGLSPRAPRNDNLFLLSLRTPRNNLVDIDSDDESFTGIAHAEPASADRGSPSGHGRGQVAADRGDDPGRGARADGGDGARPQERALAGRPGRGAADARTRPSAPPAPVLAEHA